VGTVSELTIGQTSSLVTTASKYSHSVEMETRLYAGDAVTLWLKAMIKASEEPGLTPAAALLANAETCVTEVLQVAKDWAELEEHPRIDIGGELIRRLGDSPQLITCCDLTITLKKKA
jgi:hypothetical protein